MAIPPDHGVVAHARSPMEAPLLRSLLNAAGHAALRFGIIGAGRIVHGRFAPALRQCADAKLRVVATRDAARGENLGAEFVTTRYADVIEDPDVDAIYIATHNGLHHELAMAALAAGKHVLCEKPLGRNAAECAELAAAARQAERVLVEAFMYRSHPQIGRVLELLAAHAIGEVRCVEASFSFRLTAAQDVRLKPEWGGGALLDVGCYCVNFARLILGNAPERVSAQAGFEHGVDMSLAGVLDYGGGRHALIACGFDSGLRNRALISGTEGVIELPSAFLTLPEVATEILVRREAGTESIAIPAADSFVLMLQSFTDTVLGQSEPHLAPEEGLYNARIMDALVRSARSHGSPQTTDGRV